MDTLIQAFAVIGFVICVMVGASYASDHERVFERISTAFNRIFAFVIGFSFAAWTGALGLSAAASLYVSFKAESGEPLLDFFMYVVPFFVLTLIFGILSIGAISNFIDMRKTMALISEDTAHLREMAAKRPTNPTGPSAAPRSTSSNLERALQVTAPLGETPEMTDEEKVAMAKKVAEEAIQKSRATKEDNLLDEESPTNP